MFNESYVEHYQKSKQRFDFIFGNISRTFAESKILDFGSGTGELVRYLGLKPSNYLGFDTSKAMIEKSRRSYPKFKFTDNLDKVPADYFQVVFMLDCLNFMEKPKISDYLKFLLSRITNEAEVYIHMPRKFSLVGIFWNLKFREFPGNLLSDQEIVKIFSECGYQMIDHKLLSHYKWPLNLIKHKSFTNFATKFFASRTIMCFSPLPENS
jgi:SAM-dependent methyltransferase